ncbi:MAG: DNA polymerase IV [Candidatus Micrarchaeota archaeon]|nr:DNA polymerase IV [Candidatus Micrarchaeota archaeon]
MSRIVMLIDLDSFYASVEERRNHELKGKPIAICMFSGRSKNSGAIATANYPARKLGIHSGIPIKKAKELDKEGVVVFLPADRDYYKQVSDRIMQIYRKYADRFEQVSIDEAYIEVTKRCKGSFEKAIELAERIRKEVHESEGITCTVGIGYNKFVAKMASKLKKPDSVNVVDHEDFQKLIWPLPVKKLHGIGEKTEMMLKGFGIETIEDLAKFNLGKLKMALGTAKAEQFWNHANGIDDDELEDEDKKQMSKLKTLMKDSRDAAYIFEGAGEFAQILQKRLDERNIGFKSIAIIVVTTAFKTKTKSMTLSHVEKRVENVLPEYKKLLVEFLKENPDDTIRRFGLRVGNFEEFGEQRTLADFGK